MTDLGKVESKCGAEDESQEGQPANSETDAVRKTEEWPGDEWLPHGFYWSCDDRVGDEAEGDDARRRERKEKPVSSLIARSNGRTYYANNAGRGGRRHTRRGVMK